jgi:anhydro-N-acetylmuramic acid kinase
MPGSRLFQLDHDLGTYFAECINTFIGDHRIDKAEIDAIATHGQTVFHQPAKGFTTQIGNPAVIAVQTGIPTIGDFRTKDVLHGGQGAPLVPIGDAYLFGQEAKAFLNIGGFTNISFIENGIMKAFDICPGNLPLNQLARAKGKKYDKDGIFAEKGELNYFLLDLLNSLPFYQEEPPKSLGTEWLEQHFYPLLKFDKDIENNLATVVEHLSVQIAKTLNDHQLDSVMITGGGAKNTFLMERLKRYYKGEIVLPDAQLIDFKEALIFALLGALYLEKEPNCLASVTGASKDVCGGVMHLP